MNGYSPKMPLQAIKRYLGGNSLRGIERFLKVNHRSVANWVKEYSELLANVKPAERPKVAEPDNLFTLK